MTFSLNRALLSIGALTLAVVAATSIAVRSSGAQPTATTEERLAALEAKVATLGQEAKAGQLAAVTVAVQVVDGAGLHGMEDSLKAGDLKAGYLGTVRRTRLVTASTAWPAELQAGARELLHDLEALQRALEAEDVPAATEAATAAHDSGHDLSNAVYALLAKEGNTTSNLRNAPATSGGH